MSELKKVSEISIKEVVNKIHDSEFYLPILQRPFVWKETQIKEFFDSVIREYPLGTILNWKAESGLEIDVYKFPSQITFGINEVPRKLNIKSSANKNFIIDGQQRLTSLYVGLLGSFYNTRNGRSKYLCVDLLHKLDEAGDDQIAHFEFRDQSDESNYTSQKFWYPIGNALKLDDEQKLNDCIERLKRKLFDLRDTNDTDQDLVEQNLRKLFIVLNKPSLVIVDYVTNDEIQVLDVFTRINSSGTVLTPADLLISTLSVRWPDFKAKLDLLLKTLGDEISGTEKVIDKRFVMKSLAYLLGNVKFDVKSFNEEFLNSIQQKWDDVCKSLKSAIICAKKFGFDRNTLTSGNSLLPIAQYCMAAKFDPTSEREVVISETQKIGKWLAACTLVGVYSGNSDDMLLKHKDIIKAHFDEGFPDKYLNEKVRIQGKKTPPYSEEAINHILSLNYRKTKSMAGLALKILEQHVNFRNRPGCHLDHLIPQNEFDQNQFTEERHQLANLAWLHPGDNAGFQDLPLAAKYNQLNEEYQTSLFISHIDPNFWNAQNFEFFKKEKDKKLTEKFREIFNLESVSR